MVDEREDPGLPGSSGAAGVAGSSEASGAAGKNDFFSDVAVSCYIGPANSGRTRHLVEAAREQALAGSRVLFVCATLGAASRAREAFSGMPAVTVTTFPQVALKVLSTPEARSAFGRAPRVLESHEQDILMEDMKVSQMKNRRLRAVMSYLFAGWSNLADDTWEQTYEEDLLIDRLHANLRFSGGVLACEASNLALNVLRAFPGVRRRLCWDCVVVDDFDLASRASQHLSRALARRALAVSAAPYAAAPTEQEPYPCYTGAEELTADCSTCRVERLSSAQPLAIQDAMRRLHAEDARMGAGGADPGGGDVDGGGNARAAGGARVAEGTCSGGNPAAGVENPVDAEADVQPFAIRMEPSMEAELMLMAQTCADALSRGQNVAIFGTDRIWRRNVVANLRRVGLPVAAAPTSRIKARDLNDARTCARLEPDALGRLRADRDDGVAWRTLLALGDHVARSAALDHLRQATAGGEPGGMGLREALEELSRGEVACDDLTRPLFDDLLVAYRRACELLKAPGGDGAPDGEAAPGKAGAARSPSIVVYPVSAAPEVRADVVIFGAFVNGCIPCRAYFDPAGLAGAAREREASSSLRAALSVAACARKRILFCGFSSCALDAAETMDVHIASIKLRRGVRTAVVEPSCLTAVMRG